MKETLIACPHCGNTDALEITNCVETEECKKFECCPTAGAYSCVVCNVHKGGCGASGGYSSSVKGAIKKWNRRAGQLPMGIKDLGDIQINDGMDCSDENELKREEER